METHLRAIGWKQNLTVQYISALSDFAVQFLKTKKEKREWLYAVPKFREESIKIPHSLKRIRRYEASVAHNPVSCFLLLLEDNFSVLHRTFTFPLRSSAANVRNRNSQCEGHPKHLRTEQWLHYSLNQLMQQMFTRANQQKAELKNKFMQNIQIRCSWRSITFRDWLHVSQTLIYMQYLPSSWIWLDMVLASCKRMVYSYLQSRERKGENGLEMEIKYAVHVCSLNSMKNSSCCNRSITHARMFVRRYDTPTLPCVAACIELINN